MEESVRAAATPDLARWGAAAIRAAFEAYQREFKAITRRAKGHFERRDWHAAQRDALDRLELRPRAVRGIVTELRDHLGAAAHDKRLWEQMNRSYSSLIAARPEIELMETFFNSVTRRIFATVGVDAHIEFVASSFLVPAPEPGSPVYTTYPREETTEAVVARVFRDHAFEVPYRDLEGDARLAAAEIEGYLRMLEDAQPLDAVEVAKPVFYRNKGAYLVGRIRRGPCVTPLIFALLHEEGGVYVDAVLLTTDDASIVFSFTRSYFHVETDRPRDLVLFLKSTMPTKRISELYTAVGFNKHGKTELYREILTHLARSSDRFETARGDKGMVMAVFTLPSLDIVFKVIMDRFAPPKTTTRQEVMRKYEHVFRHDRAGRLVDAQEFEHLAFDRSRFAPELLEQLLADAGGSVRVIGEQVAISHLYVERRVTPLNLYIRERDAWTARDAVLDYGQCIRDLAATNTFPGDLLLKNFGVTRTGRVIFYDYDELSLVTDCHFRDLPQPRDDDEEMSGEPWFYVAENDVFPEEFIRFLGFPHRLREAFLTAHREVLTAGFWRGMQERHRAGEIVDIFPYRQNQRLHRARER